MKIIENNNYNKLVADEGFMLKRKDDNYSPEYINEYGNLIQEHFPNCFLDITIPKVFTMEIVKELYEEKDGSEYPWKNKEKEENLDKIWEENLLNGLK